MEYVRLDDAQLGPRAGRYELRVTNELEEALFVDRLELMAVAHPADVGWHPQEGMTTPPRTHALLAVKAPRAVTASETDAHAATTWPHASRGWIAHPGTISAGTASAATPSRTA